MGDAQWGRGRKVGQPKYPPKYPQVLIAGSSAMVNADVQGETEAGSSMELTSWHFLAGKALPGTDRTEMFLPTPAPRRRDAHNGDPIKPTQLALI